jgi:hypothetical protein
MKLLYIILGSIFIIAFIVIILVFVLKKKKTQTCINGCLDSNIKCACAPEQVCKSDGTCCTQNCGAAECGPEPSGCGQCGTGQGPGGCPNKTDECTDGKCISCNPGCGERQCGPDPNGCGTMCGSGPGPDGCPSANDTCDTATGVCTCVPLCEGKTCGDNGCLGVCGNCDSKHKCVNGNCVPCTPGECNGASCGPDDCGVKDACGSCKPGFSCIGGNCKANPNNCSVGYIEINGNCYKTPYHAEGDFGICRFPPHCEAEHNPCDDGSPGWESHCHGSCLPGSSNCYCDCYIPDSTIPVAHWWCDYSTKTWKQCLLQNGCSDSGKWGAGSNNNQLSSYCDYPSESFDLIKLIQQK